MVNAQGTHNDNDQRRKRVTVEKAKAVHLSKQLQMRLQYARLKVEHGWQRQTLNEVENLYFRHSAMKSRPNLPSRTTTESAPADGSASGSTSTLKEPVIAPELVDVNMFPQKESSVPPTPNRHSSSAADAASSSRVSIPSPPQSDLLSTSEETRNSTNGARDAIRRPSVSGSAPSFAGTPTLSRTTSLDLSIPSAFAPIATGPSVSFASASSFTTSSSMSFTQQSAFSPSPFAPQPPLHSSPFPLHSDTPPAPGPGPVQVPFRPMKTFDIPTAPTPGPSSNSSTPTPLTYDSFWNTHSAAGGWRRVVGSGSGTITPGIAGNGTK